MQKQPLIGISGSIEHDESRQFIVRDYMKCLARAGGVPLLMSLDMTDAELEACLDAMDGILLSGGTDVDPALFGEQPHQRIGEIDPLRDGFEARLIASAIQRDLPLFGICRGIQVLNIILGGSIYQDLPSQYQSSTGVPLLGHDQTSPERYPSHTIDLVTGTPLHALFGRDTLRVNSCHHEAIRELAPCLLTCATSPDGVIEAAYNPKARYMLGVQWHPERMRDEASAALFTSFVDAASKTRA